MVVNNKKRGMEFEKRVVRRFEENGWWVHFMAPDSRGAQPFDIIAMKDGLAIVGDCKTATSHWFPLSRLEWNQVYAFEHWLACGGTEPQVIVEYKDEIKLIPYGVLKEKGKVDLDKWEQAQKS